jgi:hypothetical protein
MRETLHILISSWREAIKEPRFALKLFLAPGVFLLYSALTQHLGIYIEHRTGIQLMDPFLQLIPRFDFSIAIFILLYTALGTTIIAHLHRPHIILRIIEMHLWVAVVRQICILLIALEPPTGLIVLRDVFLENTVYPRESPLTKDLFFSGHVASIWLYFLCAENPILKRFLLLATLLMSFMILSMRVHYTYDVYGAILITTLLYKLPHWLKLNVPTPAVVSTKK